MKKSILVIIYVILTILGLVLMKVGGNTGNFCFEQSTLIFSIDLISLVGFVSYILSFLLFTNIVVKFDLSYITPITAGVVQVLTLVSGMLIFKENVSVNGVIGIVLVVIGIVIMNIKLKEKNT